MDKIQALMNTVEETNLWHSVFYLAKEPLPFRKVNYRSPGHDCHTLAEADAWLSTTLATWGYQVEREACQAKPFGFDAAKPLHHRYAPPPPETPYYTIYNLYARKIGRRYPDEIILLLAHKDSPSWIASPGAYDNAVGVAAVLEIARTLATYPSERSIWFLLCNEEHTPWTSIIAAEACRARNDQLVAVFNLDGLGGKSNEDSAAGRKTNTTLYTTPEGARLAELMVEVNNRYSIGLAQSLHRRKQPGDDDGSFVKAGYKNVVASIGSYPFADAEYHLEGDVPERVDYANVAMTVRATLAAVLHVDQGLWP